MNTIKLDKKIIILLVTMALVLIYSGKSFSEQDIGIQPPPGTPDGGCWGSDSPASGIYSPNIEYVDYFPGLVFNENAKGSKASSYAGGNGSGIGYCYSTISTPRVASYYSAKMNPSLPPSELNPGYYKLSDELDVRIAAHTSSSAGNDIVPFDNVKSSMSAQGPKGLGVTYFIGASLAHSGNYEFILRKDIIGGAITIPRGIFIYDTFVYVNSGKPAPIGMERILTGSISPILIPNLCDINNNEVLDVSFGLIDSSTLSASIENSKSTISKTLNYTCGRALSQDISVVLQSSSVSFSNDAILTTNSDIGVVMVHNGKAVPPGQGFPTHVTNGTGQDTVSFVVIKNPSATEVKTGAFSASATLVITTI